MKKYVIWLGVFLMINGVALYAEPCSGLEGLKRLACEKTASKTKKSRSSNNPSLNTASVIYAPKEDGGPQNKSVAKRKKPKEIMLPHNRKTATTHDRSRMGNKVNKQLSERRQKIEGQKKNASLVSAASSVRSVQPEDLADTGIVSPSTEILASDQDDAPDFVMPSRVGMLSSDVAYDTGPGVGEDELYKLY